MQADPWQFHNLADDLAHAATLKRMQGLLLNWQTATRDPLLDPAEVAKLHAAVSNQ